MDERGAVLTALQRFMRLLEEIEAQPGKGDWYTGVKELPERIADFTLSIPILNYA